MFSARTGLRLARALIARGQHPLYVQFYVTARCNLTCKQCNIIYANAGVSEASLAQIEGIAENLAAIGTGVVLLTGGEPFVRRDLPGIIQAFTSRGMHVRTQTNGLATRAQLRAAAAAGARDISISLDSLLPQKQDFLNGSHHASWTRALQAIANVTAEYPAASSFAAFGTVLSPQTLLEIPNIIRFATRIGWYVSLVPAHVADPADPHNFRSYDREMLFPASMHGLVDEVLAECVALKSRGYLLYDSPEYLADVRRFIRREPVTWRRRNAGVCDSPALYFAVRPNGDLQPCCDHVLAESFPVWHSDFPRWYRTRELRGAVHEITKDCGGCMYGSFPEMTITARFPMTMLGRAAVFLKGTRVRKPWPLSVEELLAIVHEINVAHPVNHGRAASLLEPVSQHAAVTRRLPVLP